MAEFTNNDRLRQLFPTLEEDDNKPLEGHDAEQIRLMEEQCIVINDKDVPLGLASKKNCHLMANIRDGLLHRAFSVFLFDSQNRLLLQQRAPSKITFPSMWTNTCCSHPLGIKGEMGVKLEESVAGVKRAAQRKLEHELGIKADQVPLENFQFLTRIHYLALSSDDWGEHEIDYILIIKANVDLTINKNEVENIKWVNPDEMKEMFKQGEKKFTPWFRLICNKLLFEWWENLDDLKNYLNERKIRKM